MKPYAHITEGQSETIAITHVGRDIVELEKGWWMTKEDYIRLQESYSPSRDKVWIDRNEERRQIIVTRAPILPPKSPLV